MFLLLVIYYWLMGILLVAAPYYLPGLLHRWKGKFQLRARTLDEDCNIESIKKKIVANSVFSVPDYCIKIYFPIYGALKIVLGFVILSVLIHFGKV
ncbi:hypothetical protein [Pseudalkalibacillus salsuginis]|uniref:hypothetical protein n=1 Tax=Pseudalkalibacillus salsuginis TaxID=2910972 RepID=UPI001F1D8C92|nr:hypothetical protein [Pseudalkalibacillus salsuginis]MCF6411745.1 hypothetical protein [Pseudalkalibacillus salsuginis]